MDKRWRNLLVIIVIIAALGSYFLLFSNNFPQEYSDLKEIFESKNLNPNDLLLDDYNQSQTLVNELNEYQSSHSGAAKELAEIFEQNVSASGESILLFVKINELTSETEYLDIMCSKQQGISNANSELESIINSYNSISQKIISFQTTYPSQYSQANLSELKTDLREKTTSLISLQEQLNETQTTMQELCP